MRYPEEDNGKEEGTFEYSISLTKSHVISGQITQLCSEALAIYAQVYQQVTQKMICKDQFAIGNRSETVGCNGRLERRFDRPGRRPAPVEDWCTLPGNG